MRGQQPSPTPPTERADYQAAHEMLSRLPNWPRHLSLAMTTPLCAATVRLVALGMTRGWAAHRGLVGFDSKRLAAGERPDSDED